jgi:Ca2+-binding RTX toxin-like protein
MSSGASDLMDFDHIGRSVMVAYFGNSSSETLNSSNWNYSWDKFFMGDGNDTVFTPSTGVAYEFRGGNGNDFFMGDTASDTAYGGAHQDTLYGYSGADFLDGESGNDTLYGGTGRDNLSGGTGNDRLNGGRDGDHLFGGFNDRVSDYFEVAINESKALIGQADTIYDWESAFDFIDTSIAGTSSNYAERSTSATNIEAARAVVENSASLSAEDHVFLYNASTDTGYLLSDLNRSGTFETGIIIKGAGSAADFHYWDIV